MSDNILASPKPLVFIRMPEVRHRTGLSKTTIYKRIHERTFPAAVPLGDGMVAWVEAEVDAWQAERLAERSPPGPGETNLPKAA
ncbi:TPA: AlpA family transcriptional regulator [Stenotrophomonas maltophilia]|nr:AlpA family transcriptional regulator [Stenotrophomonas maltophilia]